MSLIQWMLLFSLNVISMSVVAEALKGRLTLSDKLDVDVGVIYIKPESFSPTPVTVDQHRRIFMESLYVTQPGAELIFANSDRTRHNIFVNDLSLGVKLNSGIMRSGQQQSFEVDWDRDHIVRVGCYLHSTMTSYVASVSSNYYDELIFNNNHPLRPLKIKPVDYPFEIPLPKKSFQRTVYLLLSYQSVDPIVLDESLVGNYEVRSAGEVIGTLEVTGISEKKTSKDPAVEALTTQ